MLGHEVSLAYGGFQGFFVWRYPYRKAASAIESTTPIILANMVMPAQMLDQGPNELSPLLAVQRLLTSEYLLDELKSLMILHR